MSKDIKEEFQGYKQYLPISEKKIIISLRLANQKLNYSNLIELGLNVEEDIRTEIELLKKRNQEEGFNFTLLEINEDRVLIGVKCPKSTKNTNLSARIGYMSKRLLDEHGWIKVLSLSKNENIRPSVFKPEYFEMKESKIS
ncbi:hypothetical protein ACFSCX_09740 [Bacillus salitolerans]|uniref:Uncharacterized protein n=1 Tax=Bacillus salitolerans TaxID=1437434 RepID=A0ABW4LPC5_9BACI